jgi:hypothetical protein
MAATHNRVSYIDHRFCEVHRVSKYMYIFRPEEKDNSTIHIGIILKGVGRGHEKGHHLKLQFVTLYRSILRHASDRHLHFVVMTDAKSVPYLDKLFRKFIKRDLSDRSTGPHVSYDFFDTSAITQTYIKAISQMRPYFTSHSLQARKYRDDLFMMGPFYHRVFPYEKFIMLDADLKFRIDIKELFDHFDHFTSEQVMGVGIDLAPHYRVAFREYRNSHPGTKVGEPGRYQVIYMLSASGKLFVGCQLLLFNRALILVWYCTIWVICVEANFTINLSIRMMATSGHKNWHMNTSILVTLGIR